MNEWLDHLRAKGRKESTLTTSRYRLLAILDLTERDHPLSQLTTGTAQTLYAGRVKATKANTHQSELALAKAWAGWCVKQGWLASNPFAGIEPEGQRAAGGDVLRVDEARKLLHYALAEGTPSGLAVALALLTGARATEIVGRVARDVDDGGRLLWVTEAKTKAGVRQLEIPGADVQVRLLAQAAGKRNEDPLWGDVDRHWLGYHVRRMCRVAGVPVVSPHDLRRSHATLARRSGVAAEAVARELGQTGSGGASVLRRHYLAPGTEQQAHAETVAAQLVRPATPNVPHAGSNVGDTSAVSSFQGDEGGESDGEPNDE